MVKRINLDISGSNNNTNILHFSDIGSIIDLSEINNQMLEPEPEPEPITVLEPEPEPEPEAEPEPDN